MSDTNDNNNNNKAAAGSASTDINWRQSVLQSYRNTEVREIAKVLAEIEGNSTTTPSSKLMLAMRFEDQIFKTAENLEDYKKKITKRLKRLQKNYKPPPPLTEQQQTNASSKEEQLKKQELIMELKNIYGDKLLYIIKHTDAAVADIERKAGKEKAIQLKSHLDSCKEWAIDLGIYKEKEQQVKESTTAKDTSIKEEEDSQSEPVKKDDKSKIDTTTAAILDTSKSNTASSLSTSTLAEIRQLQQHLQKRVENIRTYVVKHADPDLFLLEMLDKKDAELSSSSSSGQNKLANNLMSVNLIKRIQHLQQQQQQQQQTGSNNVDTGLSISTQSQQQYVQQDDDTATLLALQQALEKAQTPIPLPTRDDPKIVETTIRHIDKIRAASTAFLNYFMIENSRRDIAPRQTLQKVHDIVTNGIAYIQNAVKEQQSQKKDDDANENKETVNVTLEDAWTKRLELSTPTNTFLQEEEDENDGSPPNKRPRINNNTNPSYKPYYKARLLFHPQRKTPINLLSAVQQKGAHIIRPSVGKGNINNTYIIIEFGNAFTMMIYLSPLCVNIRAIPSRTSSETKNGKKFTAEEEQPTNNEDNLAADNVSGGTTTWQSLSYGLTNSTDDMSPTPPVLSVWGVSSTYDNIGHVVEERLRDASTNATYVLRKCFQNHVKDKTVDFEVEILEGSALIEFLNIVRETYTPGWQDCDYSK